MLSVSVLPVSVAETTTQPPFFRNVPCLFPLHFLSHAADSQKKDPLSVLHWLLVIEMVD